ncbi:MAG TPA: DUF2157 domain-containing protein [Burkholderiaceae bacterium]|nr:DUF2157 domain-containing protein [Burkholderiaceae bacterium]
MDRPSLDTLAARHALGAPAIDAALQLTGLRPDPAQWRDFAARLLHAAGLAGIGAGVVFFVAANWQRFGTLGRFALLQAALVGCVAIALWRPAPARPGQAALLLATLLTGALLALFGQTYQTGADVHELFFGWALLALPFVLAAASGALWALWWGVLNVALALLCGWLGPDHIVWQFVAGWGVGRPLLLMLPWALNLLAAGACLALQRTRLAQATPTWLARGLATLGFAYGTLAVLLVIVGDGRSRGAPPGGLEHSGVPFAFIAVALAIGVATWRARRDVFPMALVAASAIVLSTTWLGHAMRLSDIGALFVIALWIVAASTGAGLLLMHWVRSWRVAPAGAGAAA